MIDKRFDKIRTEKDSASWLFKKKSIPYYKIVVKINVKAYKSGRLLESHTSKKVLGYKDKKYYLVGTEDIILQLEDCLKDG